MSKTTLRVAEVEVELAESQSLQLRGTDWGSRDERQERQ
jgi:hypothetical protein